MCECLQTLLMRLTAKMPEASQKTSAELMFKVGRFGRTLCFQSETGQAPVRGRSACVSLLLATKDGGNLKVKKTISQHCKGLQV